MANLLDDGVRMWFMTHVAVCYGSLSSTEQRRNIQQASEEEFDIRQGTVVCKHWLRSLCKKADTCEFLHRYDPRKMRECEYHTKEECGHPRCPFRHTDMSEDVEKLSCVPYDLGFCPDGTTSPS